MQTRALVGALAAGVAAVVLVGVAVTELALAWIEFSVFVGLPAGIGAGVLVAALVYLGLADGAPAHRRRIATALGTFGLAFLGGLVAGAWLLSIGTVLTLLIATGLALVLAVAVYWRDR